MIDNNEAYIDFVPLVHGSKERVEDELWFLMVDGNLVVREEGNILRIPTWSHVKELELDMDKAHCIGELRGIACFGVEISKEINLVKELKLVALRESGVLLDEEMFTLAGRVNNILNWDKKTKFCGKCGAPTHNSETERAKVCNSCSNIIYPILCPAIIVGITKEDKLLLAHNRGFKGGMYSVIAGFVDPGESLEECVKREVFEEVGIRVKNIRYFGSQPWSFPNSLMVGFFAEYESGEIKVDGSEIAKANWFTKDNLPTLPGRASIARSIIDKFIEIN
ncbi:NAD(+) diphosphatase [Clostridium sp.]|uniref:NAD(+) diphosphatase n=1 Tax=Clostridium sp. TaxID=1506 RepID=UPI003217B64A